MKLPFAEKVNYWKTGKSSPDAWVEKARKQIEKIGGSINSEAFGRGQDGQSAYMLSFTISGDNFRVVFPVLPVKNSRDERAARVQAATMLYHDIKAKCLTALVLGTRSAFFSYFLLPCGRQASEAASPELGNLFPPLLSAPQNNDDEVVVEGILTTPNNV